MSYIVMKAVMEENIEKILNEEKLTNEMKSEEVIWNEKKISMKERKMKK